MEKKKLPDHIVLKRRKNKAQCLHSDLKPEKVDLSASSDWQHCCVWQPCRKAGFRVIFWLAGKDRY